jgi:lipopolysaccharide export system permease protein
MIWKRYLSREIFKIFFLVLFSFYFIYCAFDYSLHMQEFFKDKKLHFGDYFLYYGHLFIKRADLFIPLALLIATIKVLSHLNMHREFLAFQAAGLPSKKLIRPFFLIAALCTLFNYACVEWLLPVSTTYLDNFNEAHFKHIDRGKHKGKVVKPKEKLYALSLSDRSKLIYQSYDTEKEAYFDVIWICSPEELWRMKYLKLSSPPLASYADHFKRNPNGFFEKIASFSSYELPNLKWNPKEQSKLEIPFESHRMSSLWNLSQKSFTTAYERSEIMTNFFFKCMMPLLPLLIVLAIAPFCIRYRRTHFIFFTYAFGIFGYIAFYLMMNAAVILGENHVFSPFWVIFTPFAVSATLFGGKFAKT